jgi:hypothetical protein
MDQGRHLNISKAVQTFQGQFESLLRLPFIDDSEMESLFGEEVYSGLSELRSLNHQKQFCRSCQSRCCRLVKCELYSDTLAVCPIHHFRPVLCRMHFCDKFTLEYPSLVKDLGDLFLESSLAALNINPPKAALMDSPPLYQYAPNLVTDILAKISVPKKTDLDHSLNLEFVRSTLEEYRTF